MLTIKRECVVYAMSPDNTPAAQVNGGDTLVFETQDCFSGQIANPTDTLGALDWSRINPATGPVYITGAEPGDTLKVEILRIDLAPQAAMVEMPGSGVTGVDAEDEAVKILPVAQGLVRFNDKLTLPVQTMIGVIGTAPAAGAVSTGTPDSHGGNMDCKRIGAGTTLYLPVNVPGALLAMGDLHAVMGDGEVCVCGAEIAGEITVRVSVVKGQPLPLPFLVTAEHAMAIHSAADLSEAARAVTLRMRAFLTGQAGMSAHEAGMLLSLAGDLRICQIVDPKKTCRMELALSILQELGYSFP